MESINNLIETLEILRDAVWAKNKDKGFEAVTIFLMQFVDTFGGSQSLVTGTLPILEELKDHILSGEFEEANPVVLALLVKLRAARAAIENSYQVAEADDI